MALAIVVSVLIIHLQNYANSCYKGDGKAARIAQRVQQEGGIGAVDTMACGISLSAKRRRLSEVTRQFYLK
jgi:hypothetical protein